MEDFKCGYFKGNGLDVNIILGWVPDFVIVIADVLTTTDIHYWQSTACKVGSATRYGWITANAQGTDNLEINGTGEGIIDYNTSFPAAVVMSPIVGRGYVKKPINQYAVTTAWVARSATIVGSVIRPTVRNGFLYECTTYLAATGTPEPTWPTVLGGTVTEGTSGNVFTCIEDRQVQGGGQGFTVECLVVADEEHAFFMAWRADDEKYMGDASDYGNIMSLA